MNQVSAQLSVDYGQIPFLRTPDRKKIRYSKSVARKNVFSMAGNMKMN